MVVINESYDILIDERKDETLRNYINNDNLYVFLKEAIPYFKENKSWGKYGNLLGKIILLIMKKIKNKSSFKKYNGYYWEHMQEKALLNIFSYIHKYDFSRLSPFNYVSTIIINAYRTAIRELNERPKEITYEASILTEMIDINDCDEFEDKVICDTDKSNFENILRTKIKDEDFIKEINEILKDFDYVDED